MPGDLPPIEGRASATLEPAKLQATAVSLDRVVEQRELSVADRVALRDADLRHGPAPGTGLAGPVTLQTATAQGAVVLATVRQDEPLD